MVEVVKVDADDLDVEAVDSILHVNQSFLVYRSAATTRRVSLGLKLTLSLMAVVSGVAALTIASWQAGA